MVRALFDTCILIDYLNGIPEAKQEFDLYQNKAISVITWMEVMVGTTPVNERHTEQWLSQHFDVLNIDEAIRTEAVRTRKERRVKLPDAIIAATALCSERLLVTRNTKDFSASAPGVRIPYAI